MDYNLNQQPPSQPPQARHISTLIGLIIIIAVAIIIFGSIFVYQYFATPKASNQSQNSVACTMEAKVCPDGSFVGRTGPNCEFSACPATADKPTGWKTFSENGFQMYYPPTEDTMRAPTSKIISCNGACPETLLVDNMQVGKKDKIINGVNYCVYEAGDAGMGQQFHYFSYVTVNKNSCYSIEISYKTVNCLFYGNETDDDPLVKECRANQNEKLNSIDKAISTIKFKK